MAEYRDCYIAFLDLLGFKRMIKEKTCREIATIFDEIRCHYTITQDLTKKPLVPDEDVTIKVMSDSICIYIPCDVKNALPALIGLCAYFQVRMLRFSPPVLVRGGIAQGSVYSDGDVIFGEGLVKAYILEERNAKYPRIILTKDIVAKYADCDDSTKAYMQAFLRTDFDAFLSVNYFPMFCTWENKNGATKRLYNYIESVLDSTYDDSLREKYIYLKSQLLTYYNPEEDHA